MRRQIATSKRDFEHAAYVIYHESELPFGFEAYCDLWSLDNPSIIEGHQYTVEDCKKLINDLIGQHAFGGYWLAEDYNCISSKDHWWMTVAGWGTCNFAVVDPHCNPFPIA